MKVQPKFPFEKKPNSNAIESKYLEDLRESWNIYQKEQIGKTTAKSNETHVVRVQQKKSQNTCLQCR